MKTRDRLLLCYVAIICIIATLADSTPPIQIQLRSPWPATPLVHEILEAAHEEDPTAFFTLLTHLTSPWAFTGVIKGESLGSKEAGNALRAASDQTVHSAAHRILNERQLLRERGQRDNFELSLALRSQTPKIEAFWQLYHTSGLEKRWIESAGKDCGSWVDFAGKVICSEKEMMEVFEGYDGTRHQIHPAITPFDHIFAEPGNTTAAPTAVLYADVFSSNFWSLHKRLSEYVLGSRSGDKGLRYVLRWKPISEANDTSESNMGYLAGYGAYLDLKKVDYLVIDDRKLADTAAVQGKVEGEDGLKEAETSESMLQDQKWLSKQLKSTDEDEEQTIGQLDSAELADLAVRASYIISTSDDPLRALRQLSQDFPRHGVALARSAPNPSKSFKSELEHLQSRSMQAGGNEVFLNGKVIARKDFQPFGLLPILRAERSIVNALTSLNLSTNDAIALLMSPSIGGAYAAQDTNSPFFDASDRIERNMSTKELAKADTAAITYWNDIEKEDDPRYSRWSTELKSILRPMYPGSFPVIRRNLFNLILIMDLENVESCRFLSDTVAMATSRVAVRWGFVPSNLNATNTSARLARLYWLIFDQIGPEATAKYLRRVVSASAETDEKVSLNTAEKEAEKILKMKIDEIDAMLGQYDEREILAKHYAERLVPNESPTGHAFVNGQYMPFGPHIFQFLHQAIAAQIQIIGPPIYYGQIEESADVSTYFYDLPEAYASQAEVAPRREAKKIEALTEVMANLTTISEGSDLINRVAVVIEKAFFVDASLEGIFDAASPARHAVVDRLIFKETAFTIGDKDTATLRFSILLDPLTETAQVWSSTLQMLAQMEDVYIRVMLNPTAILSELPIKRYYRYSAPAKLSFDEQGQAKKEVLSFREMPLDAVLTMGLDAPPSWLTMASDAIYDLDNIRLKDVVTPSVTAIYDLKYILIEGHIRDEVTKATPRGLQIVLETLDGSQQLDTIVMANLAYFQFRAKPGLYRLRLRQGRSTELFDMVSVGNAGLDSPRIEVTGDTIALSTLQGVTVYPRIAKKNGKEREILVEEEGQAGAVAGSVAAVAEQGLGGLISKGKGLFGNMAGRLKTQTVLSIENEHAEINVFTVASGHLYERMTYIMILSTLKHTNHTVKFWFIENFLSPSFKDFIPHLAKEYGFKYELITYAWPHWLRSQKEKQREIWGMKVLFLDVIFPLSLSKVIFVDADQIVRADLKELIDIDLKGAPYGFPPMGNDSIDMDNFRFWEQSGGYWQNFLQGKPYPISALFVVDLNKFRLQAAGDKLRGNYQALTQDPNSLSNLDQDLVASMIHVVNIHSLEKEWLWCETWCSWDWYDKAKSIDLCSNPKTKEPKLDRAKRQIPEWIVLDAEVAEVARKFKEEGKIGANVVAPVKAPSASNPIKSSASEKDPPVDQIKHTEL